MSKVLLIGCGGVANVAIRKCCQCDDLFTDICIASRTKSTVSYTHLDVYKRQAFYISIEKKGVWGYGRKIKALWI